MTHLMPMNRRESLWTIGSAFSLLPALTGLSHELPTGMALELVVPFAEGGISSQLASFLSAALKRRGYTVSLQHKPDGTGMVASEYIQRNAKHDKPCVLVGGSSVYVSAPVANPAYYNDPLTQYEMLVTVARSPQVLIARQDKLLDLAQLRQVSEKQRTCAVSGIGSDSHVAYQYFKKTVMPLGQPFVSAGDATSIRRLMAGDVLLATVNLSSCRLYFDQGLSFLATTSEEPMIWPNKMPTPTFASLNDMKDGDARFVYYGWDVLSAPRSLGSSVLSSLRAMLSDVLESREMSAYREEYRQQAWSMTDASFTAFVENERRKWSRLIHSINMEDMFD